jgi:hypothetical protein
MQVVHPKDRSVPDALALSQTLLAHANRQGTAVLAASIVTGPVVILGAMQRAGRVVDVHACKEAGVRVLRRTTTGTAAWMGGTGLVLALALPHVASIATDATDRTLLNRNVRPFLRAFTRVGAMAHYFGREWISLRKRPAALLGFDVTRKGAVLIEMLVGLDQSIALPIELTTIEERAVNRFQGKTPASLHEVLPDARGDLFAGRLLEGFAGDSASSVDFEDAALERFRPAWIVEGRDPLPERFVSRTLERVPIGYVETAVSQDEPSRKWLGGDVLMPRWVYADLAEGVDREKLLSVPIDGATMDDMVRIVSDV